jgi:two-component system, OmpR family, response regulator RegX3
VLEVGDVAIDPEAHEVVVRGERVGLPLKEFELLTLLVENAGRVLPRETLIDRVWGMDYVGDTKTLDVHIKRLRSKVEDDPANPTRIVTIRGLGYKYSVPGPDRASSSRRRGAGRAPAPTMTPVRPA